MKGLSIVNKLLFIFNFVCLLLLLIAYCSPFVSPILFWPVAFVGLLFPVLYLINILFLVFWIITLKKLIWPNIIILILGLGNISSYVGFSAKNTSNEESIKIISYNVRLFNKNKNLSQPQIKQKIVKLLEKEDADIICLQEFYQDPMSNSITLNYEYQNHTEENLLLTIYSKYPQIINKEDKPLQIEGKDMKNTCIYSDILINDDTIRVYNIHLASNWFNESEYSFMQNPQTEQLTKGVLSITKRMKTSYIKRAKQVEIIKEHMDSSPYPIIICGDFNDTPLSYAYNHIKGDLIDVFNNSGKGIGSSIIKIPALRIDYILHDDQFESSNYKQHKEEFSDHYPISCEIKINRK